MLNELKNVIEVVLNKNQMGKPSPSEFNHAVSSALRKNYNDLFADFRKMNHRKSRFQSTPNYGDEIAYRVQAMEWYIKTTTIQDSGGDIEMPSDLHLLNGLFTPTTEVEKVDLQTFDMLRRMNSSKPTACSPVYTYNDGVLRVFPSSSDLELNYFRALKLPKWTYKVVLGVEVFNPDAKDYSDLDAHPIMYSSVLLDSLFILGVNIKEEHAVQYVAQMKQESMVNKQ